MHNHVVLTGRLTGTPELRQTASGVLVCRFGVAVQRKYNKNKEEQDVDFFDVESWRGTAEFISRNFDKGDLIEISGELRTSRWKDEKDNTTHSKTFIYVNAVDFAPINNRKNTNDNNIQDTPTAQDIPDNVDLADFETLTDDSNTPF